MIVDLENISFGYKKDLIIQDVSLTLGRDSLLLIEGYSGAGKTTLLNLIGGFLKPQEGMVNWRGKILFKDLNVKEIDRQRSGVMGIVYSDYRLINHLSGMQNILLPSVVSKLPVDQELVLELLEIFFEKELSSKKDKNIMGRSVSTLSDGQKERVAVIRAFSLCPSIVLADEMFNAINPELKDRLWGCVKGICKRKEIGLLTVSHDQYLIANDHDFEKFILDETKLTKR